MPTDVDKMRSKLKKLEVELCRQHTQRAKTERANTEKIAKILSEGDDPELRELGDEFIVCCGFSGGKHPW
jgi:hypothetical protein